MKFEDLFPPHLVLCISHNDHKSYYQPLPDYLNHERFEILQDKKEMLEKDEIWEVHLYPVTPISHYFAAASTLEKCISILRNQMEKE